MSMVIRNNMSALRTYNLLNTNQSHAQKHMLKVSTGMKINSAQDDASAYSISERMRVRIRALDQAYQNTQNGSSMIKTAEGAVSNILETLRTLKEKAIDAANDSNTNEDRAIIQKEFNQLVDQIDDDALVQFNSMYLINNSRNNVIKNTRSILLNSNFDSDIHTPNYQYKFTELKSRSGETFNINDDDIIAWSFYSNTTGTFHGEVNGNSTIASLGNKISAASRGGITLFPNYTDDGTMHLGNGFNDRYGIESHDVASGIIFFSMMDQEDINLSIRVMTKDGTIKQKETQAFTFTELIRPESETGDKALSFQVGAEANQATKVALTDMRAEALGLKGKRSKMIGVFSNPPKDNTGNIVSISTKEDANAAITAIDKAITRVLDEQSNIGSFLSRLEYTATNLTTSYTNDTASESVIRDADMATEMSGYVRYNVLSQSAQAMLAQANQNPLNVLALLR